MLNHSTRPELRNTTLERIESAMTVEVEGVGEVSFDAFFTMKAGAWALAAAGRVLTLGSALLLLTQSNACPPLSLPLYTRHTQPPHPPTNPQTPTERAIPAGEEVLHTYGELSDAQLLLTYGFLESLPTPNPHNYALIPYKLLVEGAARTLGAAEAKRVVGGKLLEAKEELLQQGGLLQAAAARETEFVATAAEPLSDELLTTVQVCVFGLVGVGGLLGWLVGVGWV